MNLLVERVTRCFLKIILSSFNDVVLAGCEDFDEAAKKLCKAVKSFARKLNVIMRLILMKRNCRFNSNSKELRRRRDIVFSQVVGK